MNIGVYKHMDTLFENEFLSLTSEYKQINESLMKGIANNFKHATGKGMGEEINKTFTAFCNDYHFKPSNKNPGMFVKKVGDFMIGVKLDFADGKQASVGTVLLSLVNKKKNKKLLSDEKITIKHSHTLEELFKNVAEKLSPHKVELTKTDLSDESDDENNNDSGDKDAKSSLSRKVVRLLEDRFESAGYGDGDIDKAVKTFEQMWLKMDDNQKKVMAALFK